MTPSFITNCLTAFIVSIVLLLPGSVAASRQNTSTNNVSQKAEMKKKAENFFKEALELFTAKDQKLVRERLLQAMEMWIDAGEPEKAAQSFLQIGEAFSQDNKFLESLFYFKRVLAMKQLSSETKVDALCSIATVYAMLYYKEAARRYFSQALEQAEKARNILKQAEVLIGLATFHYQIGEQQQAISCIEKIQRLSPQLSGNAEASLLFVTGQIHLEQGQLPSAQETLEKALNIYQKNDNKEGEIKVRCSLSDLYRSSGQYQLAIEQAQQADNAAHLLVKSAVSDARKVRLRLLQWPADLALARAQRAVGKKIEATKSYYQAAAQMHGIWMSLMTATDTGAIAFGEQQQICLRELVSLLIERGKIPDAFLEMEQCKSRTVLGLIVARHQTGQQNMTSQSGILGELSRKISLQRTRLYSSSLTNKERAKIESEIEETEFDREEAKANTEMESYQNRLGWAPPISVEGVQKKMAQSESCLLEFFLGEPHSYAWLVTSDNVRVITLPGRKEIENKVEEYLKLITKRPNNLSIDREITRQRNMSEALTALLFGDAVEQIARSKKLIIVPDGILYYLPFEALIQNGKYLLEDHETSYIPAATMLGVPPGSKSSGTQQEKMELLAFGDSIFGQETDASTVRGMHHTKPILRSLQDFHLSPLPGTRNELTEIANLFPGNQRHVYFGAQSTEDAFKAEPLRRYKRIHIASHSLVDQGHPSRSAILFTLDKNPAEDGFLEVSEIANLDLDCDLVVLSACQTGRGQLVGGEGVVGLSRAFFYAGARSIAVSLWNVSDISTSRLMKYFYKNLVSGDGNAAALRKAKLKMMEGGKESQHPFYWAPFIIVGRP